MLKRIFVPFLINFTLPKEIINHGERERERVVITNNGGGGRKRGKIGTKQIQRETKIKGKRIKQRLGEKG